MVTDGSPEHDSTDIDASVQQAARGHQSIWRRLERLIWGLYAIGVILAGPLWLTYEAFSKTPLKNGDTVPAVVSIIPAVLAVFLIWNAIVIRLEEEGNRTPSFSIRILAIFVCISGPAFLAVALGIVLTNLAAGGQPIIYDPPVESSTVGTIYEHLAWNIVRTVPLVDVADAMGWEKPVKAPAPLLGFAALIVRLAFALLAVSTIRLLIKQGKSRTDQPDAKQPPSPPAAA